MIILSDDFVLYSAVSFTFFFSASSSEICKKKKIRYCQSLKPKKRHARTEGKFKSFVNLPIEIESVKSKLQRGCVVLHANHFLVHFP